MFFSAKSILQFLKFFYFYFNLEQYGRKKLHINSKKYVRFCRNLASKLVQKTFINVDYIESYLKF